MTSPDEDVSPAERRGLSAALRGEEERDTEVRWQDTEGDFNEQIGPREAGCSFGPHGSPTGRFSVSPRRLRSGQNLPLLGARRALSLTGLCSCPWLKSQSVPARPCFTVC